jgi:hypothetical protein
MIFLFINFRRRLKMQGKVSRDEWVDMFRKIGLTDEDMIKWHRVFEKRHPEGHESFLAWLGISSDERADIRTRSK